MTRPLALGSLLLVLSVGANPAHATTTFPGAIKEHLVLESVPQCTLCHTSNVGGAGTVTKPFGLALIERGLFANDENSLRAAVDQLDADATDSDSDGTSDIDELHAGTNPNVADPGVPPLEPIRYGFGCAAATTSSDVALGAALLLVALSPIRRRRRRASR